MMVAVNPTSSVVVADCVEAMQEMAACSVSAIVTDPPYGLNFMGKDWDRPMLGQVTSNYRPVTDEKGTHSRGYSDMQKHMRDFQAWCEAWAWEALRVLKPGGHLLAFGGTRTYHRLVCAVEDAGFEIRDCITWHYGSGFPKSLNVAMAIDKAARGVPQGGVDPTSENHGRLLGGHPGAGPGKWQRPDADDGEIYGSGLGQRFKDRPRDLQVGDFDPVTGRRVVDVIPDRWAGKGDVFARAGQDPREVAYVTEPATPEAVEWEGWGTALKPASEPIVVARKPILGNVASNVLKHGTGGLNIDGCRVRTGENLDGGAYSEDRQDSESEWVRNGGTIHSFTGREYQQPSGRWPANVVLSHAEDCVQLGDQRVRTSMGTSKGDPDGNGIYGKAFPRGDGRVVGYGDADGLELVERWACVPGCPVRALDDQAPNTGGGGFCGGGIGDGPVYGAPGSGQTRRTGRVDANGGASRFFYTSKASSAERSAGLPSGSRNSHPTVKSLDLMRWLVRLVTPPDGLVLDPFLGSGTTGCAAVLEGFNFVGVERDLEYAKIAEARIEFWSQHPTDLPIEAALKAEGERSKVRGTGQMSMMELLDG